MWARLLIIKKVVLVDIIIPRINLLMLANSRMISSMV